MSRRIFKILENRQPEGPSVRPLLPILSKIIGLAPSILMEGTGPFFTKSLLGSFPTVAGIQGVMEGGLSCLENPA